MRNALWCVAAVVGGYALGLVAVLLVMVYGPDVEELLT